MNKMDWDEAIDEAKERLGYYPDDYIKDWDEVVETARYIFDTENDLEYEDLCYESRMIYKKYLKSDIWKKLRKKIMVRDKNICVDCGGKATEVHHLNYNYLHTEKESDYCVSLCHNCHKKRHEVKK